MKPLQPGRLNPITLKRVTEEMISKWAEGNREIREQFQAANLEAARACIQSHMDALHRDEKIFLNNKYQVNVRPSDDGLSLHLSIKRLDQQPIHDWRDLQEIKNQLVGPECEAIEIYPAESRKVDGANQFHLWAMIDPTFHFPFGFDCGRLVTDDSFAGSVNRPLTKKDKSYGKAT
jgi:hypothetical protein